MCPFCKENRFPWLKHLFCSFPYFKSFRTCFTSNLSNFNAKFLGDNFNKKNIKLCANFKLIGKVLQAFRKYSTLKNEMKNNALLGEYLYVESQEVIFLTKKNFVYFKEFLSKHTHAIFRGSPSFIC